MRFSLKEKEMLTRLYGCLHLDVMPQVAIGQQVVRLPSE